jgi:hypothetical protein
VNSRIQFARAISVIIACFSFTAIAGWLFSIDALKALPPGKVAMNPLTAINFLLLSAALIVFDRSQVAARVCAAIALLVAASRLFGIVGYDFEIDRLLFQSELGSNRMAPNTAFCFVAASGALLWRRAADGLSVLCLAISVLALTGYLYGVRAFYGVSTFNRHCVLTAFLGTFRASR